MSAAPDPRVGLCSVCAWARIVESRRGSRFWLCRRASVDPRFLRYPPLPVRSCVGFERGRPQGEPRRASPGSAGGGDAAAYGGGARREES